MIVNNEDFKKKLGYLGMAISKNVASKQSEKMVKFDCIDGIVYAYTSDGVNNIRVEIGPSDKDFYAVVDYATIATFVKSCEGDITLVTTDKFLQIKSSNVKCKIPTYNHELKRTTDAIPDPVKKYNYDKQLTNPIDLKMIKSMLDPNHVVEVYQKVYFGDCIMVSDTDNVIKKETRVFDKDILLDLSSIEIINVCSNLWYTYDNSTKTELLCIKSDELYATLAITNNDNNDFQYEDFLDLYNAVNGPTVVLDTTVLSKAINASSMFKTNPIIVFNPKGIFVQIDAVEFIYKISDEVCQDRQFELSTKLTKLISTLGKDVVVYFTNPDLIKCKVDDMESILSIVEVPSIGK